MNTMALIILYKDSLNLEFKRTCNMSVLMMSMCRATSSMILPPPKGHHYDQLGAFVVAPCTHDKKCPLDNKTWCSFSQKVTIIDNSYYCTSYFILCINI